MKFKLNICVLFAIAFLTFGAVSNCFAQDDDEAGGYVKASVTDANVKAAANFAVKEKAKQGATVNLLKIDNAQMQVVAGVNFELCLEINYKAKNSDEAIRQFIKTVVYRDLKNVFSLTSWTEDDCAEQ